MRVGLVGAGRHCQESLIPAILLSTDLDLVAVATRSDDSSSLVGRRWSIPSTFASYAQMIETCGLDFVVVSGHPQLHESVSLRALAQGLPVFVEKPPAASASKTLSLADLAGETPTFVDFNFRFATAVMKALEIASLFGPIRHVGVAVHSNKPRNAVWAEMSAKQNLLYVLGVHGLDLVTAVMGPAIGVKHETEAWGEMLMICGTSTHAKGTSSFAFSNCSPSLRTEFSFICETGAVVVKDLTECSWWSNEAGSPVETFRVSGRTGGFERNGYQNALQSFAKSVSNGTPSESSFAAAHHTMLMAEALL